MITINLGDLITDVVIVVLLVVLLIVLLCVKLGELLSKRNEKKMLPDDDIKYYCENDVKAMKEFYDFMERSESDAKRS